MLYNGYVHRLDQSFSLDGGEHLCSLTIFLYKDPVSMGFAASWQAPCGEVVLRGLPPETLEKMPPGTPCTVTVDPSGSLSATFDNVDLFIK